MNDDITNTGPKEATFEDPAPPDLSARSNRVFLCVVDNTEECVNAIYFAACRARRTGGRLALLYIMEPAEFQHWMSVEEKMREEARAEAEDFLHKHSSQVQEWTGEMPTLYVREGKPAETILGLIEEEPRISILVLGAGTDKKGPGPLVSSIGGKMSGKFPIPITIVPGTLTSKQLDMLT
ncbi:MAG: universal stress protein [Rhodospirillaceae bacterium]|nr:universal stress protein [Rhodospirillaceae bacterium]